MEPSCLRGGLCGLGYGLVFLPLIVVLGSLGLLIEDPFSGDTSLYLISLTVVALLIYPLLAYIVGVIIEKTVKRIEA